MKKNRIVVAFVSILFALLLTGCNEEKFQILFDSRGGSDCIAIETTGAERITLPIPEKDGYVFEGWYLDEAYLKPLQEDTFLNVKPISDMTAYAKWRESERYKTYRLKNFVVKNEYLGDITISIDRMSAEEEAMYGAVLNMYGRTVEISNENNVKFTGSVLSLYNPSSFVLQGEMLLFDNSELSSVFNSVQLREGKFYLGIVSNGTGFEFEYWSDTVVDQPLLAPTGLKILDGALHWDAMPGALNYEIVVNGESFFSVTNRFSDFGGVGIKGVKVRAEYVNGWSGYSQDLYFRTISAPSGLDNRENSILKWSAVDYALSYVVDINGKTYTATETSFDLLAQEDLVAGDLRIRVKAVGDGITTFESAYSPEFIVKKYSDQPVIELPRISAIGLNDPETAQFFNATAMDGFGTPLEVLISRSGKREAGGLVSYTFTARDRLGNVSQVFSENVAVYGLPTITYDTRKNYMFDSDTPDISLFSVRAFDSFGVELTPRLSFSGSLTAGTMKDFFISAVDNAGNISEVIIRNIKIYGEIVLEYEPRTALRHSETLSPACFHAFAYDSFRNPLEIRLEVENGSFEAGNTITVSLLSEDSFGREKKVTLSDRKVYGNPELTFDSGRTVAKESDRPLAEFFNASAVDSFGTPLEVAVETTAEWKGGAVLAVRFRTSDPAGNIVEREISKLEVFGIPEISVKSPKTQIRETDATDPAFFGAVARDSFRRPLTVTMEKSGLQTAGATLIYIFSVTDSAGNSASVELRDVKIYGAPELDFDEQKLEIRESDTPDSLFFGASALDSFNRPIEIKTQVLGIFAAGETVSVRFTATDAAGNETAKDLEGVKVYGAPVITGYADRMHYAGVEFDTRKNLSAVDSFGKDLTSAIEVSGKYNPNAVGNNVITVSVSDHLGNRSEVSYLIRVEPFRGTGAANEPYCVENAVQLGLVKNYPWANFKLLTDVTVEGEWIPVGTRTIPFTGIFDGNGHKVSIRAFASVDDRGFFGVLKGQVRNLCLSVEIEMSYGTNVGGVAGNAVGAEVYNCNVDFRTTSWNSSALGGLVGIMSNTRIANCLVTGELLSGAGSRGGLVGKVTITDNSIINCLVRVVSAGTSSNAHGNLVGVADSGSELQIQNTFFDSTLLANYIPSEGVKTELPVGNMYGSKLGMSNSGGRNFSELTAAATYSAWDRGFWTIAEGEYPTPSQFSLSWEGEGTAENPYLIATAEELDRIRYRTDACYRLTADISIVGEHMSPILSFSGALDGGGHKLNLCLAVAYRTALFENLSGEVKNLNLELSAASASSSYAGTIAGVLSGTIRDCKVTAETLFGSYSGGVVAVLEPDGTVENVVSTIMLAKGAYARGGIAALMNGGTVRNCSASIEFAPAEASTTASFGFGGIAGRMVAGVVEQSRASVSGDVTVAKETGTSVAVGGIAGKVETGCMIRSCIATGKATAFLPNIGATSPQSYAGGIAGLSAGTIENCRSLVTVAATADGAYNQSMAGGIVGSLTSSGSISYSYASASVSASQFAGGIAGVSSGTVTECYYDGELADISAFGKDSTETDNAAKLTSVEMLLTSTYANFGKYSSAADVLTNPGNVWIVSEGALPILWWENKR